MPITMTNYPECEKMRAVRERSQSIGEFLEWLEGQGITVAKYHEHSARCEQDGLCCDRSTNELVHHSESTEKLLARFFEIDLNKVEEERRAMIEELAAQNASK